MRYLIYIALLFFSIETSAHTSVLASIKPIYGITLAIVQNTPTSVTLLLPGDASEHDYHLKPSDLQKIKQADIILWVGPELETFLSRPLAQLKQDQTLLGLLEKSPVLLEERVGNPLESPKISAQHRDPHVWLNPDNAIAWAYAIAECLASQDPEYAEQYQQNATSFEQQLASLKKRKDTLQTDYVMYHDAFQYFDAFFGSRGIAAIHSHLEDDHHISGVVNLETIVATGPIAFLGSEPYVHDRLLSRLSTQFHRPILTLDPLGILIDPSPTYYESLIRYHLDLFEPKIKDQAKP